MAKNRAYRTLFQEYKYLQKEPIEGFNLHSVSEESLFVWDVAIYGPPDSLYEGACLMARMKFPTDYPFSPPTIRFLTKVWHPNVYHNGDLCISILHPPLSEPRSGELPCERWNPTQNIRTILLSVVSLLNEPNIESPANVDAAAMYRRWRNSNGKDKEYEEIVRKQALISKKDAEMEGVIVPTTREDYCMKTVVLPNGPGDSIEFLEDYSDMENVELYESDEDSDS